MDVGGAEPVEPRGVGWAGGEEFVEIGADAVEELAGGVGEGRASGDESGGVFGEAVEAVAVFFVGIAAGAEGCVGWVAGAPDLEGFADVVSGVAEEEREGRDGAVPVGSLEDGTAAGAEEVAAGEEGAAAGRAGGGVDEGVAKESAFAGDAVDVGRVDEFVSGRREQSRRRASLSMGMKWAWRGSGASRSRIRRRAWESVRVGAFRRLTGLGGPAPCGDDDSLEPWIECADGDGCCGCGGGGCAAADWV